MTQTTQMPMKLPFWRKIMYAMGQLGWSLATFTVANMLNPFYVPATDPSTGTTIYPVVLSSFIIVSIAGFGSRIFDAITDPLIAGWSDRSKSKFGKRRTFLAIGAFPFAIFSFLVFFPPFHHIHTLNSVWLFLTIIPFYFFLTMYVTPFFALMSELGHNPAERLQLSTMISITWAMGFMIGNQIYLFQDILSNYMSNIKAFQTVNGIFAILACIFMYLPVIFVNENKYCKPTVSKEGSFKALKNVFKNKNFLYFALSDLTYWLSLTFISTGASYYVVVLLGLEYGFTSTIMTLSFAASFVFYFFIPAIAKKTGKKKLIITGFIAFIIIFASVFFMGMYPIEPKLQGIIILLFASIPLAIFGILPNAIVADIADADGFEKGNFKAAIFFGARTFMSKLGQSITLLLFPLIATLQIGKTKELITDSIEKTVSIGGVRITAIIAVVFCIIGLLLFLKYDEKHILKVLKENEKIEKE